MSPFLLLARLGISLALLGGIVPGLVHHIPDALGEAFHGASTDMASALGATLAALALLGGTLVVLAVLHEGAGAHDREMFGWGSMLVAEGYGSEAVGEIVALLHVAVVVVCLVRIARHGLLRLRVDRGSSDEGPAEHGRGEERPHDEGMRDARGDDESDCPVASACASPRPRARGAGARAGRGGRRSVHDGEPPAILGAARGAPLVPDPRAAHGRADERYERACAHPHATVRRMTLESGLAHERAAFRRCEEMLKHVLGPRRRPR